MPSALSQWLTPKLAAFRADETLDRVEYTRAHGQVLDQVKAVEFIREASADVASGRTGRIQIMLKNVKGRPGWIVHDPQSDNAGQQIDAWAAAPAFRG